MEKSDLLLLARRLRRGVLQAIKVDREFGRIVRAADDDWDNRTGAIPAEETVGGTQQHALPTADHLRHGGLHARGSVKVHVAFQSVLSLELDGGSGYVVAEIRQSDDGVHHVKGALHFRTDVAGIRRFECLGVSL